MSTGGSWTLFVLAGGVSQNHRHSLGADAQEGSRAAIHIHVSVTSPCSCPSLVAQHADIGHWLLSDTMGTQTLTVLGVSFVAGPSGDSQTSVGGCSRPLPRLTSGRLAGTGR